MKRDRIRLLRWGSVLYAPQTGRIGIYLSSMRILGAQPEWTLRTFAGKGPIWAFQRGGIAVGELDFLEYVLIPDDDIIRFLGRKCGMDDCRDWKTLQELLCIRYGAELGEYEMEPPPPTVNDWSLANRYGVAQRKREERS